MKKITSKFLIGFLFAIGMVIIPSYKSEAGLLDGLLSPKTQIYFSSDKGVSYGALPEYSFDNPFEWNVEIDKKIYNPGDPIVLSTSVALYQPSMIFKLGNGSNDIHFIISKWADSSSGKIYSPRIKVSASGSVIPETNFKYSNTVFPSSATSVIDSFLGDFNNTITGWNYWNGKSTHTLGWCFSKDNLCGYTGNTLNSNISNVSYFTAPSTPGNYYFYLKTNVNYRTGNDISCISNWGTKNGYPSCAVGFPGQPTVGDDYRTVNYLIPFTVEAIKETKGILSTPNCTIIADKSSCKADPIKWSTTNPVSGKTSSVTTLVSGVSTTVATGNSGTSTYIVKYNEPRIFYLYHNGLELAKSTATATCDPKTTWDTVSKTCKDPIVGGWTSWVPSSCPTTCGLSASIQTRTCTNPKPDFGGSSCSDSSTATCAATAACAPGAPKVDIFANKKDSETINSGSKVDITWNTENVTSCTCTYSGGDCTPTGKTAGNGIIAKDSPFTLSESKTFTVRCH